MGDPFRLSPDPELLDLVKERPGKYLNLFSSACAGSGLRLFSYKVFPKQVELPKLRAALKGAHQKIVFITRSRLDCYISFQKAMVTRDWGWKDTTDQKPVVDAADFLKWCAEKDQWYRIMLKHARETGLDYRIVSYEADIDCPKDVLIEKQILMLRSFGLDFRMPAEVRPVSFVKQDKSTNPFDKVANGEAWRRR